MVLSGDDSVGTVLVIPARAPLRSGGLVSRTRRRCLETAPLGLGTAPAPR